MNIDAEIDSRPVRWVLIVLCGTSGVVLLILSAAPLSVPTFWIVEGGAWAWLAIAVVVAWRRPAYRGLLVVLALLTASFVISPPGGWFDQCCPEPMWGGSDGVYYWEAGRRVVSGEDPWSDSGYLYPPPLAQFFGLLHAVPAVRALGMWTWLILASYLTCVVMTYHLALQRSHSGPVAVAATALLWLVNRPALESLSAHQVNLAILALLLFAWAAFENHRAVAAGMISLAAMLKIAPLTVAVFPAIIKWRWLIVFVPVAVALSLGAFLCNQHLWLTYFSHAAELTAEARGLSVDALMLILLPAHMGPVAATAFKCLLLVLGAVLVAQTRQTGNTFGLDVSFAVAAWSMVLLPPTVWGHYLVWFTPALLVCWLYSSRRRVPLLAITTVIALWMPVLPPPIGPVVLLALGLGLLFLLRGSLREFEREPGELCPALVALLSTLALWPLSCVSISDSQETR